MPLVDIDNVGSIGVIAGVPPGEMPPEAWSAGQNVRMFNGLVMRSRGHQDVFALEAMHLLLDGTAGNYASTPDSAANSITGDIDLRAKVAPDDWSRIGHQAVINKYSTPGYLLWLDESGQIGLQVNGTVTPVSSASVPFTDGSAGWIRATLDLDNGAGSYVARFYTSNDGVTWTQLGTDRTGAAIASITDSTSSLDIGRGPVSGIRAFVGKIYYAEVRNGIDGTVVAKFDPANDGAMGATSFTSATGEVWTINGTTARLYGGPIPAYWAIPVVTASSYFWIYAGLKKVYVTDMSAHYNLTRQTAGADVDYNAVAEQGWNGCVLGGIPIVNNTIDAPQMWNPVQTSTKLSALSNWPASTSAAVVRAFRQHLVALDVTKSGTRYPYMVKWSHPADPGSVPSSWNETDPTKDAGEAELKDTADFLVDCLPQGNVNIIYKEDTTWGMEYSGKPNIWRFYPLLSTSGLISRHCVQDLGTGEHLVASRGDILRVAGKASKSILTKKQRTTLFNDIDTTNYTKSVLTVHKEAKEVWFCYPETGETHLTKALVWNWIDNTFGYRELPDLSYIVPGIIDPGTAVNWDAQTYTWAAAVKLWDAKTYNPLKDSLLMVSAANVKLYQADETEQFSGVNYTAYVQRDNLAVVGRDRHGNWKADPKVWKYVRGVWPKMRASGSVNVYIGGRETIDGAITWEAAWPFDPSTDNFVPCDTCAPYICIKIESTGNVTWELDGYALDLELVSRY